ncbi:MAG: alpha/beta hydrolase [Caulobacter sp.]|nr:alpha/beta hydrolase [Caulobacter sp.]
MTEMTRRLGLIGLAGALAAACTPARFFNTVTLTDPARQPLKGVSFGPLERNRLDVYAPVGGATNAPVCIFIYGGGWDSGARGEYAWAGKAMAAEGFVTVVPDYRLVPEVAFPAFLQDVALAVKWTVDNIAAQGGDPSRIVLVGHSAGAYNAAMVALDPRYLKAVGVDRALIKAFAGLAGPYYFPDLSGPVLSRTFGPAAEGGAYQTLDYARPGSPPAFLAAGSADKTVRPRNTERLAAALREQGVEVESHIYPGLSHADVLLDLSRTFRRRSTLHDDMMAFLKRESGLA